MRQASYYTQLCSEHPIPLKNKKSLSQFIHLLISALKSKRRFETTSIQLQLLIISIFCPNRQKPTLRRLYMPIYSSFNGGLALAESCCATIDRGHQKWAMAKHVPWPVLYRHDALTRCFSVHRVDTDWHAIINTHVPSSGSSGFNGVPPRKCISNSIISIPIKLGCS